MGGRATYYFNQLTEAEAERLFVLVEECSEVIKECMKILRHGYNPTDENTGKIYDNRRLLETEISQMIWTIERMLRAEDLDPERVKPKDDPKKSGKYFHHT